MTKNKVLIFGGSGFIGSHFKKYFEENLTSFDIFIYDLKKNGDSSIDVREKITIDESFSAKDVIINLAAVHTTPGHPDLEYYETNILGAENICEFAERVGIQNIIFTSSIAPYGASEKLKTEKTLPTPNTPYGISKLIAEYIHKEWAAASSNRKLLILRPGVVFGKGENGNFTRLASAIAKGIFFYPGRKDTIKACIYVKELVQQSWELFNKQEAPVVTYNASYYPAFTIEQIVNKIANTLNKKPPKILINSGLLKLIARILKSLGLGKLGIHPDRVKKLMTSTNISGEKLKGKIKSYNYTFEESLIDWYNDCDQKGLF